MLGLIGLTACARVSQPGRADVSKTLPSLPHIARGGRDAATFRYGTLFSAV